MVLFKINGERNSGTNYLENILKKNGFNTYNESLVGNIFYHWKHGVPSNDYKIINNRVIDVFIFRELNSWLVSMFHNVYHLQKKDNFNDFLQEKQFSNEKNLLDYRTNQTLNEDDNGKTIFEIREYKYNEICKYRDNNKDIIFVNLSYIQNEENLYYFLFTLNKLYYNNNNPKFNLNNPILKIPYCKPKNTEQINIKNKNYNIDINNYIDIINSKKNEKIENFINNLTFTIK